ncbi:MAG TPA: hypothetical protein VFN38_10705 [Gemmatimonadaceae bacterium]|nr:hypothetical protein [Gemmatimonadaceae bacterium]
MIHPSQRAAPRVLVVMADQWPRALLRAALRDVGYDAIGTRTLETALRLPDVDAARGPVRLIVVDQSALGDATGADLEAIVARHGAPPVLLLASATVEAPAGPWRRVLRRPVSVADIVAAVESMFPLPATARRPLD